MYIQLGISKLENIDGYLNLSIFFESMQIKVQKKNEMF